MERSFFDNRKRQVNEYNDRIGALIETPAIYMNLSAFDNLKTKALLYDITDDRIKEVLKKDWARKYWKKESR